MSQERTATTVPKRTLVDTILRAISEDEIRTHFHIGIDTSLKTRLQDFAKTELLALLTSTSAGQEELATVEQRYPLSSSPTLYLVKVRRQPDVDVLVSQTSILASTGRQSGIEYGRDRAVRIVYVASPAYTLEFRRETTEIPLLYERRIEYTVCDPDSDEYGERQALYSLERAFVWITEGYSHAIICCSDFVAVRPIINFGSQCLGFAWALPDLTEEMLNRLAADASPRSATFAADVIDMADILDVRTLTVSDPQLGERQGFKRIKEDANRQQTAGYFSNHPDLLLGGLGIARRYGRIWTPAHLGRRGLVSLALGIIQKTEKELAQEYERNLPGYIHYFGNLAVTVGERELKGKGRRTFDELAIALLRTSREGGQATIGRDFLHALTHHQTQLSLTVAAEFDCPNCGLVLGLCPNCQLPYTARMEDDVLVFQCPNQRCGTKLDPEEGFACECGQIVSVAALENHVWMSPQPELLDALREFFGAMNEVDWNNLFCIRGHVLKLLPIPSAPPHEIIDLADLRLWRVRAHYHVRRVPNGGRREILIRILRSTKEKCKKNNGHPTHQICRQCLASRISVEQVEVGEICLPRIFGLAIAEKFDGVHHGHEVADVKYQDTLDGSGVRVKLGIHLKSRTRAAPKGLGRSKSAIKALYTQFFYSAYLAMAGRIEFDVIGISIPNSVSIEVVGSLTRLVNELGFCFLLVDEDAWVRIVDTVLEQLELE